MSRWSWSDVYPDHRVFTVIMAPGDAETFLAMPGVRIVGNHVALVEAFNAPLTADPKPVEPPHDDEALEGVGVHIQTPDRGPPSETVQKALRPITVAAAKKLKADEPAAAPAPALKPAKPPASPRPVPLIPATEPLEIKPPRPRITRTVGDHLPKRPPRQPERPPSSVSARDLALVEEALASGKVQVTKCPPMTFTPDDEIVPTKEWPAARKNRLKRQKQAKRKAKQTGPMGAKGG